MVCKYFLITVFPNACNLIKTNDGFSCFHGHLKVLNHHNLTYISSKHMTSSSAIMIAYRCLLSFTLTTFNKNNNNGYQKLFICDRLYMLWVLNNYFETLNESYLQSFTVRQSKRDSNWLQNHLTYSLHDGSASGF